MNTQLHLQEPTKAACRNELPIRRAHGEDSVGVDFFNQHRSARRRDPSWDLKRREIVRHDDASGASERFQHAGALVWEPFDERVIEHARPTETLKVISHSLQNRGVNSSARPTIPTAQRFNDKKGFSQLCRPVNCSL